jgi:radical SAM protein with 4Fe4S-binding SPASM domain
MANMSSYVTKLEIDKNPLWKDKRPLLSRLDMELTERCNNNCIHCCINLPAGDQMAKEKELYTAETKDILIEAASLGCLTVRFTGGEPLLREDFEEIYLFARKLGLKVLIFTNATLITPHLAELFVRIPPLETIEITVYGMKSESYEAVTRTPGSFKAAWKGIDLLLKNEVPFVVKSVILPQNRDEMEEFEAWAASIPWMNEKPSYSIFFDLRHRRDSQEKNRFIEMLRPSPEEGLKIITRRQERYVRNMRDFCSKFTRPPGDNLFSCGAGTGGGCVDAYGHFQLCMLLRHPDTVYDLKRGSIKDAMVNFFPNIRATKAVNPNYMTRCASCFLKGLCEQCPAKSWIEHGTLDDPLEYHCEVTHIQAIYLGLLEEDEKAWRVSDWKKRMEYCINK